MTQDPALDPIGVPEPEHPAWQRILGTLGGLVLGGVLLVGLYGKALHPEGFAVTIADEGLDFLLPASWVAFVGLGLESILGLCLVLGLRNLRVLLPSAALVAFFLFLTGRGYLRWTQGVIEDDASCGCFGTLVERTPEEAFFQDLFLLVPPLLSAFVARPSGPVAHARARYVVAGAVTAAVLLFAWFAPDLPLDDWATRLRPGTDTGALCSGEGEGRLCMDTVIPELHDGRHVVLLVKLDDPGLKARLDAFNEYALAGVGPPLWVVVPATEEAVSTYRFLNQPAFEIVHCPPAVVRPLYRRLPRTFLTRGGTVTETWQDWPPLERLERDAAAGNDGGDPEDGDADRRDR